MKYNSYLGYTAPEAGNDKAAQGVAGKVRMDTMRGVTVLHGDDPGSRAVANKLAGHAGVIAERRSLGDPNGFGEGRASETPPVSALSTDKHLSMLKNVGNEVAKRTEAQQAEGANHPNTTIVIGNMASVAALKGGTAEQAGLLMEDQSFTSARHHQIPFPEKPAPAAPEAETETEVEAAAPTVGNLALSEVVYIEQDYADEQAEAEPQPVPAA